MYTLSQRMENGSEGSVSSPGGTPRLDLPIVDVDSSMDSEPPAPPRPIKMPSPVEEVPLVRKRPKKDPINPAIENWIVANNLNEFGEDRSTQYLGSGPLFDMSTGKMLKRYEYIEKHHPDKPWETPAPTPNNTQQSQSQSLDQSVNLTSTSFPGSSKDGFSFPQLTPNEPPAAAAAAAAESQQSQKASSSLDTFSLDISQNHSFGEPEMSPSQPDFSGILDLSSQPKTQKQDISAPNLKRRLSSSNEVFPPVESDD